MYPRYHIILGAMFSILILILFKNITLLYALIIFASSFLIDVDHYLFYAFKKNEISLKKAYNWHVNLGKKHKTIMHLFHTLEFHLLVLIFALFFPFLWFVFIGMLFHSVLDLIDMAYNHKFGNREYSLIRYLLSDKKHYI